MPFANNSRRLTLIVLAAYLAVNSLGTLVHEQLHAHPANETCCHVHACPPQSAGETDLPALGATAAHDHACVVCRVNGQPLTVAATASVELSDAVTPDPLPCPSAATRSLAARLAKSRAPPVAAI